MNKFVFLTFFALAAGALADYAKPAYHAAPAHHGYEKPAHHGYEKPAHHGYEKPAHHGYEKPAHHGYEKPAHHHAHPVVHTYPVHAPHAKCGANLLVGCAPSVAHVPCVPVHGHGYGHGHGHGHGYRAPESDQFDQFEE